MASSVTGTSTSNPFEGKYQVFLNFRGLDTRRTFTDSLYNALVLAGIGVFLDDEELQVGERIGDNLLQAIDNSKLYILIFSKNYATSHWCLDELARMVKNAFEYKEEGKHILPIFYDVKPDDVKLKTKLYNEAISNLEGQKNKFSSEDIRTWREALIDAGHTKGWELEKYKGYTELIKEVVNRVVVMLEKREMKVTEDLVGMDDRVADIKKLLDIDSGSVQLIAIYGMSGIGKTTLAKIIFNHLHDRFGRNCSFLDDVKEIQKTKGLKELQRQLLSDISYNGVAPEIANEAIGTDRIEEIIGTKKVLIVLDNVEEDKQIKNLIGNTYLYPGTIILVTTKDPRVLTIRKFKYKFKEYEMLRLSEENALKLFSRYAFDDDSPPEGYYTLSKRIVSTMDGLPLALEAIGSLLYDVEDIDIWKERLKQLRKTPLQGLEGRESREGVLKRLMISYDTLVKDHQHIFLDIACFFVGESNINPMYMWNGCGLRPKTAIEVLTRRRMIKLSDNDEFRMHDLFKDLGRKIAKDEHTRLWDKEDFFEELRLTEGNRPFRGLCLKSGVWPESPIIVTSDEIKRFPCIRFLWLSDVICKGDFTGCFSELRWISLDYGYAIPPRPDAARHQRFEATNSLHLQKAVVVNLSGVDITEDVLKSLVKEAKGLKVLTLCYNTLIHGTPTFPPYSDLEKLTISKFFSLMKIDCSIGRLTKLTDLSFELCVELAKLPKEIGELQELKHLSLRSCDSLMELPDSVLKLKSLTKLDVLGTRITRLPDSIDRLSELSFVNVSFTSIEKLPSKMGELLHLETLHLNHCDRIQVLPELPKCLTTLQLTSTSLVTVPNLSYLTNLVELALSDRSESIIKSDIIQTCNLQWIRSLSKLRKLQFCFSNVCVSTIELGSLSVLEELTLHGLDVPTFKQLPSELMVLELYDTRGKHILPPPSEKEKENAIVSSSSRESEEEKERHAIVPSSSRESEEEKERHAIVPSSSRESGEEKVRRQIEIMFIEGHESSKRSVHLPELGCNELQAPKLIDHWRGDFLFPSSINMLRKLVLWGCPGVQDIQFVPTLLLVFSVGGCTSLKRLGGLSYLKYLMELTLKQCPSLQVVEGIDELEFLRQLEIKGCRSVEGILNPSSSKLPKKCSILITCSGELPDCGRTPNTWESYKEKILNGTEIGTTDSETEKGDAPLQITSWVKIPQLSSIYERSDSETEIEDREAYDFYY